jgi:energy-converting hydrogenase Eha subunit B
MASAPESDYAVMRVKQAWDDLSTCRSIGMVVGPIPYTAIVTWCDVNGLDPEAMRIMTHVIRVLDIDRAEREAAKRKIEDIKNKRGRR